MIGLDGGRGPGLCPGVHFRREGSSLDHPSPLGEGRKRFSVLYQLYRFPGFQRVRLVVDLDEGEPVDSIVPLYRAADWAEREIFDMFGIPFAGHPDLRRIYMPDEFVGHPLRKDFPLEGNEACLLKI
jgi:NADH:ubiquinone oxidoreductase subunit C